MQLKLLLLLVFTWFFRIAFSQNDSLFVGKHKFALAKLKLLSPPPGYDIYRVNDTVIDINPINGAVVASEQLYIDSTAEKPNVTRYNLSPATIIVSVPYKEVQNLSLVLKSGKQMIYFNNCSIVELVDGVKTNFYVNGASNGRLFEYWNPDDQLMKGYKIKRKGIRLIVKDLYYTKNNNQYALDIEVRITTE